jgi:hypothetical protein
VSRYLWHETAERIARQVLGVVNFPREELYVEAIREAMPLIMEELRILETRRAREEARLGRREKSDEE